jgi:hypothetical protein
MEYESHQAWESLMLTKMKMSLARLVFQSTLTTVKRRLTVWEPTDILFAIDERKQNVSYLLLHQ